MELDSAQSVKQDDAEEWRPVPDWPYEVSSHGRVRRAGKATGAVVGRILRQQLNVHGYPVVSFSRDGSPSTHPVHRLVAGAFLGQRPEGGFTVDHRDGIKTNCRPVNLEYVTRGENSRRALYSGLMKTKLKTEDVAAIRAAYAPCRPGARRKGLTTSLELQRRYGVCRNTILMIARRDTWRGSPWS